MEDTTTLSDGVGTAVEYVLFLIVLVYFWVKINTFLSPSPAVRLTSPYVKIPAPPVYIEEPSSPDGLIGEHCLEEPLPTFSWERSYRAGYVGPGSNYLTKEGEVAAVQKRFKDYAEKMEVEERQAAELRKAVPSRKAAGKRVRWSEEECLDAKDPIAIRHDPVSLPATPTPPPFATERRMMPADTDGGMFDRLPQDMLRSLGQFDFKSKVTYGPAFPLNVWLCSSALILGTYHLHLPTGTLWDINGLNFNGPGDKSWMKYLGQREQPVAQPFIAQAVATPEPPMSVRELFAPPCVHIPTAALLPPPPPPVVQQYIPPHVHIPAAATAASPFEQSTISRGNYHDVEMAPSIPQQEVKPATMSSGGFDLEDRAQMMPWEGQQSTISCGSFNMNEMAQSMPSKTQQSTISSGSFNVSGMARSMPSENKQSTISSGSFDLSEMARSMPQVTQSIPRAATPAPAKMPVAMPNTSPFDPPKNGPISFQMAASPRNGPIPFQMAGPPRNGPTAMEMAGPPKNGPIAFQMADPPRNSPIAFQMAGPPKNGPIAFQMAPSNALKRNAPTAFSTDLPGKSNESIDAPMDTPDDVISLEEMSNTDAKMRINQWMNELHADCDYVDGQFEDITPEITARARKSKDIWDEMCAEKDVVNGNWCAGRRRRFITRCEHRVQAIIQWLKVKNASEGGWEVVGMPGLQPFRCGLTDFRWIKLMKLFKDGRKSGTKMNTDADPVLVCKTLRTAHKLFTEISVTTRRKKELPDRRSRVNHLDKQTRGVRKKRKPTRSLHK